MTLHSKTSFQTMSMDGITSLEGNWGVINWS